MNYSKTRVKKIFFNCVSGFPYKISASNDKNRLIAKALINSGIDVIFINKFNMINTEVKTFNNEGFHDGIRYINTTSIQYKKNTLKILILAIKAIISEIKILKYRNGDYRNECILIISFCFFPMVIYYRIITKLLRIKLVISIMEFHKASNQSSLIKKINAKLFDDYSFYFSDGAIAISDFLIKYIKEKHPKIRLIKLPVIADYEYIDNVIYKTEVPDYFLYCGSAGYADVIDFILECYELLNKLCKNVDADLVLVISGKLNNIKIIKKAVKSSKYADRIKVLTKLSYNELIKYYKEALALLIPLRPTLQDKARFPHKVGEYLASGKVVISTNYGEVGRCLVDGLTALLSERYSVKSFTSKMEYSLKNKIIVGEIGMKGKFYGRENFDFRNFSENLVNFFESL